VTILTLTAEPDGELADGLEAFERQFQYPLGPGRTFRVSHGRRYLPFFQAMGEARVLVALTDGEVQGTLAIVPRRLVATSSTGAAIDHEGTPVHYLCDLKIAPGSRGGPVLSRLFGRAGEIVRASGAEACYAVVMEGTGRLPVEYTGRLGVPAFEAAGRIVILRLTPKVGAGPAASAMLQVDAAEFAACSARLTGEGASVVGGDSRLRSERAAVGFVDASGGACGVVEDTLLGKRLFTSAGEEMRSAHLSRFVWNDGHAAGRLLESVVFRAREWGYPALFVAVPEGRLAEVRPHLGQVECVEARARVFGHQVPVGANWWINTAEI